MLTTGRGEPHPSYLLRPRRGSATGINLTFLAGDKPLILIRSKGYNRSPALRIIGKSTEKHPARIAANGVKQCSGKHVHFCRAV